MRRFSTMRFFSLVFLAPVALGDVQAVVNILNAIINRLDQSANDKAILCAEQAQIAELAIERAASEKERFRSRKSSLNAQMVRDGADIEALQQQITKDEASLTQKEREKESAAASRAAENKAFLKKEAELSDIMAALRGAIAVLNDGSGTSLLQGKPQQAVMKTMPALKSIVSALSLDTATNKQLTALVQAADDGEDFGEYVSRGADVNALMNKILSDASAAYSELKTAEQTALFEHNRLIQELNNEIATLRNAITMNKQAEASKKAQVSADTTSLNDAEGAFNRASALLATLKAEDEVQQKECKDFAQQTKEQINSMSEAVKVLTGPSMANAVSMVQAKNPAFLFLQMGVATKSIADDGESADKARAARFLADMAERMGSPILSQIGEKIKGENFDFVIRMIEDMLLKLDNLSTAAEFCAHQLEIDTESVESKKAKCDRAETLYDKAQAELQQMKTDLDDTVKAQNQLQESITAFDAQREASSRERAAMLRDLQTMKDGLNAAIAALNSADVPIPDEAMVTLRDKLASVNNEYAQWEAVENGDEKEHKYSRGQMEADHAGMERMEKDLRRAIITQKATLAESETEMHDCQVSLGAIEGTLETQKKDCNVAEVNAQDRARRTEKEKLALQEALAILKGS